VNEMTHDLVRVDYGRLFANLERLDRRTSASGHFRIVAASECSILTPPKPRGILSGVVGIEIDMET
jgi:hypothetical protein